MLFMKISIAMIKYSSSSFGSFFHFLIKVGQMFFLQPDPPTVSAKFQGTGQGQGKGHSGGRKCILSVSNTVILRGMNNNL